MSRCPAPTSSSTAARACRRPVLFSGITALPCNRSDLVRVVSPWRTSDHDLSFVPLVDKLIHQLVATEVLPTSDGDRQALEEFAQQILERFYNPFLQHRMTDSALKPLSKWTTRNLPVVQERWVSGGEAPLRVLFFAVLLVLYSGASENTEFKPRDEARIVEELRSTFNRADIPSWVSGAGGILSLPKLIGEAKTRRLTDETSQAVDLIFEQRMDTTVQTRLG